MKELSYWDVIKSWYKVKFNIPPKYIDFIACYPILLDCVTGYGNVSISRRNKVPEDYVQEVLFEFLSFLGWEQDLDISPYAIFKRTNGNLQFFMQEILMNSAYIKYEQIPFVFKICKRFHMLKEWADKVGETIP